MHLGGKAYLCQKHNHIHFKEATKELNASFESPLREVLEVRTLDNQMVFKIPEKLASKIPDYERFMITGGD